MMVVFEFYWLAVVAITFVDVIQAQRRDEGFNSYGGQPISQNTQTGQRSQPLPQFNGPQRWTPLINNPPTNQQSYNNGFQRAPARTLGADSNRPYNGEFQQGPPRTTNNVINRPYNVPPRPLETTDNGYNRPSVNYGGFQRGPQLPPASEQNRQFVNGQQQRPLVAINNAPNSRTNNNQPQGIANSYGQNRPYIIEPQRPSFANNNLGNRAVYYGGPQRGSSRNDSNTPIYIRTAQRPPTPNNDVLSRPIYNVGGPIRVLDSESNRPINLNGFQSKPVTESDAQVNKHINLEESSRGQTKETDEKSGVIGESKEIVNNVPGETSSVSDQRISVSDVPKSSTTSSDLKRSSLEVTKDSNPSNSNESTLLNFEKSNQTSESETVNTTSRRRKHINKLKATTPSNVQNSSSLNTSKVENTDTTEEI